MTGVQTCALSIFSIRIFNMLLAITEVKYANDMTDSAADEIIPNILAHKSIFNNRQMQNSNKATAANKRNIIRFVDFIVFLGHIWT